MNKGAIWLVVGCLGFLGFTVIIGFEHVHARDDCFHAGFDYIFAYAHGGYRSVAPAHAYDYFDHGVCSAGDGFNVVLLQRYGFGFFDRIFDRVYG